MLDPEPVPPKAHQKLSLRPLAPPHCHRPERSCPYRLLQKPPPGLSFSGFCTKPEGKPPKLTWHWKITMEMQLQMVDDFSDAHLRWEYFTYHTTRWFKLWPFYPPVGGHQRSFKESRFHHTKKVTKNYLKMMFSKKNLFHGSIVKFHYNFRECTFPKKMESADLLIWSTSQFIPPVRGHLYWWKFVRLPLLPSTYGVMCKVYWGEISHLQLKGLYPEKWIMKM